MGNCGSSLNCSQCFYPEPRRNCTAEIEVNADIAGIGVLASLYFSAWVLSLVVVWGWFRKSLPSDLLTSTDHYVVQLVKRRRAPFSDVDVRPEQTTVQEKVGGVVTGFTKVLGDQQLISGIAILTAGLASRCDISLYEFNIVTCLAYLCVYTHLLSLQVLREYLYKHTFVRVWRVGLTIGLFCLFGFSYTVNTAIYDPNFGERWSLNMGNMFQCVFEALKFHKSIRFDAWYSVTLIGAVAYRHILAIGDLFVHPETDTVSVLIDRIMSRHLKKTGLSKAERREVVCNAQAKYYSWLRPPGKADVQTSISSWYYLQAYFDSYMSSIPGLFAGMSYGTVSTIQAVWGEFDTTGLESLGFGQVVALGLLLLTLLAAAEIRNEQSMIAFEGHDTDLTELNNFPIQDDINDTTMPDASVAQNTDTNGSHSRLEWIVQISVPKPKQELYALAARISAPEDFDDSPAIARRIAMVSSRIWVAHTCFFTYVGLGWNFSELEISIVVLIVVWKGLRLLLVLKRILNHIYFVKIEAEVRMRRNNRLSSPSRQPLVSTSSNLSRTSVASTQPSTVRSSSPPLQLNASGSQSRSNSLPGHQGGHVSDINAPVQGVLTYRGTFPFTQAQ